jgi:uncharacterized protein with von Willebrand factor type A (vWA) domain
MAFRPRLDVWLHSEEIMVLDLHLAILIDRSGSMRDEKIQRAISFATLVSECAGPIPGVEGRIYSFDDKHVYPLGSLRQPAVAELNASGGNNDAGALHAVLDIARQSQRRSKIVLQVSDGIPTECTFQSLKHLVESLRRESDIQVAQVAVDTLSQVAFPNYVDLTKDSFEAAVRRFGLMVRELMQRSARNA